MKDLPINFICAGKDFCELDKFVPAPYFRFSFNINKQIKSADIRICGLGYYFLYINGQDITKGYFAPYRSNPDDIIYYDVYDITDKINSGKNTIGAILGNGFQNPFGGFIWDMSKAPWRAAPQLAFDIEITYFDGTSEVLTTDENTLTAPSPILFDDLHFGEYYDARLEIPNWNLPELDDSNWKNCEKAPTPRGKARICEAEPIIIKEKIKPISITKEGDAYRYDFGVNNSGLFLLKISGQAGQKVVLKFGETIVDGKLYTDNIRFNSSHRFQEDEYTCKGSGVEEYTPKFTYHGYRYALVYGIAEEQATKDLLTYLVMSSDLKINGGFECDNDIVNKIQEITVRSSISNFYYFPTDCPQREKNGWTADAALSSEEMLLNITPENSYKEWLRNIHKAMSDDGKLPGIVPTSGWGYSWGNGPAWDNVLVYLPYYTYIYRGDKSILEESAIPFMRYLNYLFSRLDSNNLISIGLGDWCPPGKREDQYASPVIVTDSILTVDIAEKCAFMFDVLNMKPQKEFAESLAIIVKSAIRKNLIKSGIVDGDCQTSQAMAIYYNIFDEDEKADAFAYLLKLIDKADGHFDTGVLGGRIIYRLLADNDEAELAYNMITRTDFPSYGNWIVRGATTLWESFMPEGGRILSLNHHFWGDVSAWFYKYLAGINVNPDRKNVNCTDIKPYFISSLSHVKAWHNLPCGKLMVEWNRNENGIILDINAPLELEGTISLHKGYLFADGSKLCPVKTGSYNIVKFG